MRCPHCEEYDIEYEEEIDPNYEKEIKELYAWIKNRNPALAKEAMDACEQLYSIVKDDDSYKCIPAFIVGKKIAENKK